MIPSAWMHVNRTRVRFRRPRCFYRKVHAHTDAPTSDRGCRARENYAIAISPSRTCSALVRGTWVQYHRLDGVDVHNGQINDWGMVHGGEVRWTSAITLGWP